MPLCKKKGSNLLKHTNRKSCPKGWKIKSKKSSLRWRSGKKFAQVRGYNKRKSPEKSIIW